MNPRGGTLQLLCGQCGNTLDAADALAGGTIPCPHCSNKINVPIFGATMPMDSAIACTDDNGETTVPFDDLEQEGDGGFASLARQSQVSRVRVVCGGCRKGLEMTAKHSGKRIKCPACGASLYVPYPDEEVAPSHPHKHPGPKQRTTAQPDTPVAAAPLRAVQDGTGSAVPADSEIIETVLLDPATSATLSGRSQQPQSQDAQDPALAALADAVHHAPHRGPTLADPPAKRSRAGRYVVIGVICLVAVVLGVAVPVYMNRLANEPAAAMGNAPAANHATDVPPQNHSQGNTPAARD